MQSVRTVRRTTRVGVTHLAGQENIVKKVGLLLKSFPIFRSTLNKEDGVRDAQLRICLSTDVNECVEGLMVVIPTPFVITLWVLTNAHADQDYLETEETAA